MTVSPSPPDALLVIDLQTAMFSGEQFPPMPNGDALLARVAGLIETARESKVPVIYVRHDTEAEGPLHRGSPGWAIAEQVAPQPHETIIDKQRPDAFLRTNLAETLTRLGATRIAICGAQSDFCVDTTTRSASAHGYEVALIEDAHSTWGNGVLTADQIIAHHNVTLKSFATLITSANVFAKG